MYKAILVDDESIIRNAISTTIDWNKFNFELVDTCQNATQAIEILKHTHIDLIITDICMPHMDGLELSSYVYNNYPDTSIVIISGYDNICYNKEQNRIIMPLIPLEDGTLENKYMGCEVDLNNLQFSFLKMAYPNDYKNRERLQGGYFIPHFSVMDENHILYNFYGDSRFWIYDIQTNKTTELNMPSNYTPNIVDYSKLPEKQKELVKEEYKSLRFREIHYIPELHYFARIHYAPKEKMSNKDTRKYLMLMNEDRQVVKEFILPLSFDGRYFIFNTDIFFFIRTDNPDNEIKLAKINLKPLCI